VSADIKQGEVVGVIGHNGAGKSTLLKMLSQITEPSEGEARLRGRLAALLEVGTGFHQELTGRENIYMNGAILGMSTSEINKKFDQIVDFAGVGRFVDTPVKRFSSGMLVRLGFSIAAHLDPEILVVDEVLAVGDMTFQRQCVGKIDDVARSGRTVVFVSHSMPAIQNICPRTLLLSEGRLHFDGATESAVQHYSRLFSPVSGPQDLSDVVAGRQGSGVVRLTSIELRSLGDATETSIPMGDGFRLCVGIVADESATDVVIGIELFNDDRLRVCSLNSYRTQGSAASIEKSQSVECVCELCDVNLAPGRYHVSLQLRHAAGFGLYDSVPNALTFEVMPADVYATGRVPVGKNVIFLRPRWLYSLRGNGRSGANDQQDMLALGGPKRS
jgi:lipopolysaccharide transport system ATP-binding protein